MPVIFNKTNRGRIISIAVLFLINLWLFWPGDLYFLNDDLLHIPLTDQGKFFQTNSVRPMHELLVRIDLWLYNKHAYGYHVTALLFHFVVCIQLFDLTFLLQVKWLKINNASALKAAFFAVILFLAYPQHAESLAWISGRGAILSTIFALVTVRLFFSINLKLPAFIIGVMSFAAALFSYEQCIFLPIVLLAIAIYNKQADEKRKQIIHAVLLLVTAMIYIIIRKLITLEVVGYYEGSNYLSMNFLNLAGNFLRFISRLFLNPASSNFFTINVIILLAVLVLLSIVVIKKVHINIKALVIFTCAIFILIIPVLSLGISTHSFESGRYLYLPSVFLVMAISTVFLHVYEMNGFYKKACAILFVFVMSYWLYGKFTASADYKAASTYARNTNEEVLHHFNTSTDTLHIDTLRLSVHRLPVFRLGFKTGIKWLNNNIDTNKVVVEHAIDDSRSGK